MNKKLILGALVLGVFTLNSCVDDKESASVTAIREAKAEQLKAIGEAAKIQAEAEATAASAYAAVQAAQAKLIAAQEAAQLAQTQIDQEKAAAEIQRLQAELEAAIAKTNAEAEILKAEAEAQNLANQSTQISELNSLLGQYSNASTQLVTYQRDLVVAQNNLAAWEANLVSWEELRPQRIAAKEQEIVDKAQEIADNDAGLAAIEQYYGNIAAAKEQRTQLAAEATELLNAKTAAYSDWKKASSDLNSANTKINDSRYMQIMDDNIFKGIAWSDLNYGNYQVVTYIIGMGYRGLSILENWAYSNDRFIPLYNPYASTQEEIVYSYEDGQRQYTNNYTQYADTINVLTESLYKNAVAKLNNYIKENQEAGVTAAQTAYNNYLTAANNVATAQATLNSAQEAETAAQKVVTDAGTAATAAQITVLANAQTAVQNAQTAVTNAENAYNTAYGNYSEANVTSKTKEFSDALDAAKEALANAQAVVTSFETEYKTLSAQQSTYEGYIANYNEASKSEAETYVAYVKADNAYNTNQTEISTLNYIIDAGNCGVLQYNEDGSREYVSVNVSQAIDILKDNQTTLAAQLADLQDELEEIENGAYESDCGKTEDEMRQELTEDVEDAQLKVDNQKKVVEALSNAISQLTADESAE